MTNTSQRPTQNGTDDNDDITGGSVYEIIYGLGGNDTLQLVQLGVL